MLWLQNARYQSSTRQWTTKAALAGARVAFAIGEGVFAGAEKVIETFDANGFRAQGQQMFEQATVWALDHADRLSLDQFQRAALIKCVIRELIPEHAIQYGTQSQEWLQANLRHVDGAIAAGIGICNHFARAADLLAGALGIQSRLVLANAGGVNLHAYNKMKLEGHWYYLDTDVYSAAQIDLSAKTPYWFVFAEAPSGPSPFTGQYEGQWYYCAPWTFNCDGVGACECDGAGCAGVSCAGRETANL